MNSLYRELKKLDLPQLSMLSMKTRRLIFIWRKFLPGKSKGFDVYAHSREPLFRSMTHEMNASTMSRIMPKNTFCTLQNSVSCKEKWLIQTIVSQSQIFLVSNILYKQTITTAYNLITSSVNCNACANTSTLQWSDAFLTPFFTAVIFVVCIFCYWK